MEIDRDALMPVFLSEAEEQLDALEEALLGLEASPGDPDLLGTVFRMAHTLKGNAESLGQGALAVCAHALESLLDAVRGRGLPLTSARASLALEATDALRALLRAAAAGGDPTIADHQGLLDRLAEAALGREPAGRADAPLSAGSGPPSAQASRRRTLRVDLPALDRVMTLTSELSIARSRLRTALDRGRAGAAEMDALSDADRLVDELRDQVMRLRLVPIGPMFRAQLRAVRDLAAAHGKVARLVVEGEDVEVDTAVIEALRDPVTHMIRNAVDHGIEAPAARVAQGKSPVGTITLSARYEGGRCLIEVRDDGAGLRRDRILERARATGLLREGRAPTDEEIDRLVFAPGFSTALEVTDLSGRGVGLDVVARNVASLEGSIAVESAPGVGTTLAVRVPLTLAVMDGFVVEACGESYVIPLDAVRGCAPAPRGGGAGVVDLRGEPLPCLRVRDLFSLPGPPPRSESIVVVEHAGRRAGLTVDALAGGSQSVVKPLGRLFDGISAVTGSTILGDGRVALILDVPSILHEAATRRARRPLAPMERS